MSGDFGANYRYICSQVDYDPDDTQYRTQVLGFWNAAKRLLFAMKPWTFAEKFAVLSLQGDYATGTAIFTSGSRTVVGSGTAWTTAMEGSYIQTGTSAFSPTRWARIGRVGSATTMFLVDPWPFAGASGVAHTIRQRYVPMPRDCINYENIWNPALAIGEIRYMARAEFERVPMNEETTGTTRVFASAESWTPPTPERALTATLSASAGTLVDGRTYQFKYTWVIGGTESGASPVVEVTAATATPSVNLTDMQEVGATDGRYLRLYMAEKDVGIYYRVATYSNVSTIAVTAPISDRTYPYMDGAQTQYIQPYPRYGAGDSAEVRVRYHAMPRETQKLSDYEEMPLDAIEAIRATTIADVLGSKAGMVTREDYWRGLAKDRIRQLESHYLVQAPSRIIRRPFDGRSATYLTGSDPSVTTRA